MIHFRLSRLGSAANSPILGLALTPADVGLILSGHPIFINLHAAGVADAKGVGVYFVRDSRELVGVLRGMGMDEEALLAAGVTPEGKPAPPPVPVKEPYFT
jgi:hypothetical protein